MSEIQELLDTAFDESVSTSITTIRGQLPINLAKSIDDWQFGKYGWTSPVNLFLTAAWYKWLHPLQDVCKIWARDHQGKKISDGFAIRSFDEKYTVPLVTKTGITPDFCSPNSGMQGSRAIEKMRSHLRIERNTPIDQAVSFDMALFQIIMNDINECTAEEAYNTFKYLLKIGINIKEKRIKALQILSTSSVLSGIHVDEVVDFIQNLSDPQFVKIAVAGLLEPITKCVSDDYIINGIEGSKTAADSQSKAPGDFWFESLALKNTIGVEVKDRTKQIGFEILQAIENRKINNPKMTHYFAVSASNSAVNEIVINDKFWKENLYRLRNELAINVITIDILNLSSLFLLCGGNTSDYIGKINQFIPITSDIKADSIALWKSKFLNL